MFLYWRDISRDLFFREDFGLFFHIWVKKLKNQVRNEIFRQMSPTLTLPLDAKRVKIFLSSIKTKVAKKLLKNTFLFLLKIGLALKGLMIGYLNSLVRCSNDRCQWQQRDTALVKKSYSCKKKKKNSYKIFHVVIKFYKIKTLSFGKQCLLFPIMYKQSFFFLLVIYKMVKNYKMTRLLVQEPRGVNLAGKGTNFHTYHGVGHGSKCKELNVCRSSSGGCGHGRSFSNGPHRKC